MTQLSFPWPKTDPQIGDGREYTDAEWANLFLALFGQGVLRVGSGGVLGDLEAIVAGPHAIQISTGCAMVHGRFFSSDTVETLSPADAPVGQVRQDAVILRCSWAGGSQYKVRLATKEGSAGSPPTVEEISNDVWEIALYTYQIDDSGIITHLENARPFTYFATMVSEAMLDFDVADQAEFDAHVAATSVHSATAAPTASRLIFRDGQGRAQVAAPDANADIARKDTVDAVQTNLDAHRTALSPLDHPDGSITAAKLADAIDASAKSFNAAMVGGYSAAALLSGGVIEGAIVMWFGALGGSDNHRPMVGGVPNEDWHVCNGETVNAMVTPDMQNRFPVGASGTLNKGETGGAASSNLYHRHAAGWLTTVEGGGHVHYATGQVTIPWVDPLTPVAYAWNSQTASSSGTVPALTVEGNSAYAGSATQENRPPFLALHFICKVS